VLELHGWGELGKELHAMSRTDDPDRWGKVGDAIDDEVLDAFAVVGPPDYIATTITQRVDDVMDRLQFYAPYPHDTNMWSPIIADMATP
jgi:hypothetical protein